MRKFKAQLLGIIAILSLAVGTRNVYGQGLLYAIFISAPYNNQDEKINARVVCAGTTSGPCDTSFDVVAIIVGQPRSINVMSFDWNNPGNWNGSTGNLLNLGAGTIRANLSNDGGILASTTQDINGVN